MILLCLKHIYVYYTFITVWQFSNLKDWNLKEMGAMYMSHPHPVHAQGSEWWWGGRTLFKRKKKKKKRAQAQGS